ncbi:MAG TPA: hypothetical protein PKC41_09055 [Chitinophagaceae bacterium]|jgi:thiol-disulfide isomerase/thioredoxin|nr:hypothetical protein [Chitinophagaceae bacterium]
MTQKGYSGHHFAHTDKYMEYNIPDVIILCKFVILILFIMISKNILIVLTLILCAQFAMAQDFVREEDRVTGKPILRGKISFENIKKESTCSWFEEGAEAYIPNRAAIETLNSVWKNYRFVLFIGTWCEDTRNLLPKFYKTLLDANISPYAIEMYGVNRAKHTLQDEHKYYNIERVPTIIIMHQKREVGRIVESVTTTIEEEMAMIMEKDAKELEIKKAEEILQTEEQRKLEIMKMRPRDRKRYFAPKDWY